MSADLFSREALRETGPHIFSVTEITRSVRTVLEETLGVVWVEGEISNHRRQASGHQYFTLKDAGAQLSCVLFARPGMWRKQIPLADGMCVQVRGALTVYEARGQYQLNVQLVQAAGEGLLQAKFEALKRKLDAEGLFDPARKRPLPAFPRAVAIITSPTGAALRDMLHILTRRAPWLRVIISPARVQGEGAAAEIIAAIEEANALAAAGGLPLDVIVLARGGGSAEDLWQFNDEQLARAIAASELPIVSAVGHEIDFTISDFVADLRAPTPSAAAELIAPDSVEVKRRLASLTTRMQREVLGCLHKQRNRVALLAREQIFREPRMRLQELAQRIDSAADALQRAAAERVERERNRITALLAVLRQHRPDQLLKLRRQQQETLRARLAERYASALRRRREAIQRLEQMLRVLSPQSTLERGYTITTTEAGELIDSASKVRARSKLRTRFHDGEVISTAAAQKRE